MVHVFPFSLSDAQTFLGHALSKAKRLTFFALCFSVFFFLSSRTPLLAAPEPDASGGANATENTPALDQAPAAEKSPAAEKKPTSPSESKSGIHLFGTVEFKRPLSSLPAWLKLLERNKVSSIFVNGKQFTKSSTWETLKKGAEGKKGLDLLRYVHNFWNKWPYREDPLNWGVPDYWAIPDEFLKKSGDCEDYAIIKYFTLKELGIPADKMRIVVLRDTIRNLAHAVLVVYLDNDVYVLDNLSSAVLSHTRFRHYMPQYSVNELGRWAHLKGRPVAPAAKGK